jgi:cyclopropane fatty-acyl-phospholipid synthase-like methyltransferase
MSGIIGRKLTNTLGDPYSVLFSGTDKVLFRGITTGKAALYRDLFERGVFSDLSKKGLLIETDKCSQNITGFELTLQHRRLPFVTFPEEWSATMYQDAALCVLNLEMSLVEHGLTLLDAHPWNVVFEGSRPVWVDVGSLVSDDYSSLWMKENEFMRFFLFPLRMYAAGHGHVVRSCINGCSEGIDTRMMLGLSGLRHALPASLKWNAQRIIAWFSRYGTRKSAAAGQEPRSPVGSVTPKQRLEYLRKLHEQVSRLKMPVERTAWSHYYESNFPDFNDRKGWNAKHISFAEIIDSARPSTVLDIGANTGWFSEYAARHGAYVLASDMDEMCVDSMYKRLKNAKLPVSPLVMNIRNPTPAKGLEYKWWPSAVDRFQVDMVVALAVMHHLVFKNWLDFEQIISALSAFTKDALVVEFVGPEDKFVREWMAPRYDFYNESNLTAVLRRHYRDTSVYPSNLEFRKIFFCKGKV